MIEKIFTMERCTYFFQESVCIDKEHGHSEEHRITTKRILD